MSEFINHVGPLPVVPPRIESLYNRITRRIRAARTIFADNVKLDLRQRDDDHWSKLPKPYLLVVPTQTRAAKDVDDDSMIVPRTVMFVAQFNGVGSEGEHLASVDIETAEKQLIWVLCNWTPEGGPFSSFEPTVYAGMRIQETRVPDVKVVYLFTFNEQVVLPAEPPSFDDSDALEPVVIDGITFHVNDPCCNLRCDALPVGPVPTMCVTGGGCPTPPDPCAPTTDANLLVDQCPPILGDAETKGVPS